MEAPGFSIRDRITLACRTNDSSETSRRVTSGDDPSLTGARIMTGVSGVELGNVFSPALWTDHNCNKAGNETYNKT